MSGSSIAIIIVVCVFLLSSIGFLIFHLIMVRCVFERLFGSVDGETLEQDMLETPYYQKSRQLMLNARKDLAGLEHKRVEITSFDGLKLVAYYYDYGRDKTAILIHGYHSLHYNNFGCLAKSLIENGYNVLMPYERAHGESEGKYVSYGYFEHKDLLTWIDYADKNLSCEKIMVYGVSMGAATVGLASEKITCEKVKVLVFDCGFNSINALYEHIADTRGLPKKLVFPGVKRLLKKKVGITFNAFDVAEAIKNDKLPMFFIYGEQDDVIPQGSVENCFQACQAEKQLITVAGAGHTCAIPDGGSEILEKFYSFINRFI